MDQSLSIVLPVRNVDFTLNDQVTELLDFLPELTSQFEIVIVDDASTDDTEEVAHELARRYPQVRVHRHRLPSGYDSAAATAMELTSGDIIFVQDEGRRVNMTDIRRLWQLRTDPELVMARSEPTNISTDLMNRLTAWGETLRQAAQTQNNRGGIQMIRRAAATERQDGAEYQVTHIPPPNARNFTNSDSVATKND